MTTTELRPTTATPTWDGAAAARAATQTSTFIRRHADALVVGALILVAFGLRVWITRGLWLDEATSVAQAKMDFGRMLSYLRQSDVHPPLFHMILWLDIRVFGTSELAVRLPSIAFGTLLVPVLYMTGRELFNRSTGLVAALIGAIGPAAIWYSQEARMYPLFMLFAALTIWAQVRVVRGGSRNAWIAYSVFTAALLWTHYFSILHVAVQQLAFIVLIWQQRRTPEGKRFFDSWLRSVVAIALMVAPLVSIPLGQISNYGIRDTTTVPANGSVASGAPIYTAISNIASALVGYHSDSTMVKVNAMWPLAMLAGLLTLGRGRSRSTLLLVGTVAIPLVVLFIVGLKRNDVFELRYFAGAVPALALLLARGVTLMAKRPPAVVGLCSLLVLSLGAGLVSEQHSGGNARVYDFRSTLEQLGAEQQPGDLMLYEPFYLHPTVHYYAPQFTSYPLVAGLTSTTAAKRIYIVDSLAFAEKERSQGRVEQVVTRLQKDRKLVEHIQRNHIEVWVFE